MYDAWDRLVAWQRQTADQPTAVQTGALRYDSNGAHAMRYGAPTASELAVGARVLEKRRSG